MDIINDLNLQNKKLPVIGLCHLISSPQLTALELHYTGYGWSYVHVVNLNYIMNYYNEYTCSNLLMIFQEA